MRGADAGASDAEASAEAATGADAEAPDVPPALRAAVRCGNCEAPLVGPYCGQCGQRAATRLVPLRDLAREAADDLLGLDLRLVRTLPLLLARPGVLTVRYLAGRRRSYVRPLRLVLATGFLFLLALGLAQPGSDGVVSVDDPERVRAEVDSLRRVDTFEAQLQARMAENILRAEANPDLFFKQLVGRLTVLGTVLLPLFALLLKLLYVRHHILYVRHLIFTLHVHAFFLTVLTTTLAAAWAWRAWTGAGPQAETVVAPWLPGAAALGMGVYLYVALRRVYGQGYLKTALKLALLLLGYLFFGVLAFVMYALAVVAFF